VLLYYTKESINDFNKCKFIYRKKILKFTKKIGNKEKKIIYKYKYEISY